MHTPGSAPRWGQYCRRLILLISLDWVPPYCDPSRACLTLGTRVGRSRLLTSSRVARTPWPHPDADPRLRMTGLAGHRNLLGNRPHERDQFPRDGGYRDVGMLAARGEATKALAEPHLSLPADVLNRFRQPVDPRLDVLGDLGGIPIRPGGFGRPSCLERGRRATDHSTVVPNPRISAGSTVGSTGPISALTRVCSTAE